MTIILTANDLKEKHTRNDVNVFIEDFNIVTDAIEKADAVIYSDGNNSKVLKNKNGSANGGLESAIFILLKGLSFYDATNIIQSVNHNLAINAII